MKPQIINGQEVAKSMLENVRERAILLKEKHGIVPTIAVILVGHNPASQVYVGSKIKKCAEYGIGSRKIILAENTTEDAILNHIHTLNNDPLVHGILVQLPLPKHINKDKVIDLISPQKDVDGFHPQNVGKIFTNQLDEASLVPCTPKGCLKLIKSVLGADLRGKNALVIGASNIVGRPMSGLLLNEKCTVAVANSSTKNLSELTKWADIIVVAVGIAGFLKSEMVREGVTIIDVGINRIAHSDGTNKIVGDCDFETCLAKSAYITPVPGGVGPMTIACLLENTVIAAENSVSLRQVGRQNELRHL